MNLEYKLMRQLQIIKWPNPILKKVCESDFTVSYSLISKMFELMNEENGLGLAAPQVGLNIRLFVTYWGEVFINPFIIKCGSKIQVNEGCLSFPNVVKQKTRFACVEIAGKLYRNEQAIVIQHEADHLDGITIID